MGKGGAPQGPRPPLYPGFWSFAPPARRSGAGCSVSVGWAPAQPDLSVRYRGPLLGVESSFTPHRPASLPQDEKGRSGGLPVCAPPRPLPNEKAPGSSPGAVPAVVGVSLTLPGSGSIHTLGDWNSVLFRRVRPGMAFPFRRFVSGRVLVEAAVHPGSDRYFLRKTGGGSPSGGEQPAYQRARRECGQGCAWERHPRESPPHGSLLAECLFGGFGPFHGGGGLFLGFRNGRVYLCC